MNIQEYRNWRPIYSSYNVVFPEDAPPIREVFYDEFRQFLALSGLSCEASEAQAAMHKTFRKGIKPDYSKIKDELSDVESEIEVHGALAPVRKNKTLDVLTSRIELGLGHLEVTHRARRLLKWNRETYRQLSWPPLFILYLCNRTGYLEC